MAFVTRYGNVISEDGWRMVDQAECEWISPAPGVTIQVRKGIPATILGAFAARFNAVVEPLRDNDTACWTPTNSVGTSNHMAGTAMDLNWGSHPFHARGTYGDRLPALRRLLDDFEGCVWWGGDWQSPIDEMHFQLNYREGYLDDNGNFVLDVDDRLTSLASHLLGEVPAPQDESPAAIIVREGQARGYTRDEIIACLSTGIQESGLNQAATDSTGHRGIFQQDGGYPNRETAVGNIAGFFDRLDAKRRSKGGVSPDIWKNIFWLQQRPSEPSAEVAYARGRQHYLVEIQSHILAATDLYNRYVTAQPMEDDGFMSALTPEEQRRMYDEICGLRSSRSPLHRPGEGNIGDIQDLEANTDGSVHILVQYLLGVILRSPRTIAELRSVATSTDPNQVEGAKIAQAMLNKIAQIDQMVACPVTGEGGAAAETPSAPVHAAPDPEPIPTTPLVGVPPASGGLHLQLATLRDQVNGLTDILNQFLK
jgi:hypothetical protein